jgi:outer membrane protein OmpU
MMPTAWEETDGTGLPVGLRTVAGAGGNADIEWNVGMGLPDGMNAYVSVAKEPDGSKNTNKGTSGANATVDGYGWDLVLTHSGLADGLNVFAGYSEIEQVKITGNREAYAIGATYAVGGATLGYQHSKDRNVAAGTYYENNAYGISFAINDNLSVSYGRHDSDKVTDSGNVTTTLEADSIQLSYTVGGASIKVAESDVDGQNYVTGTNREGRTIALTLAF